MKIQNHSTNRRNFLRISGLSAFGLGLGAIPFKGAATMNAIPDDANSRNIIGPKEGYSPQIGTLVSMMTWMREVMLMPVQKMTQQDLDFLFDAKANTIGAMLMHLAATERFYQIHTLEGKNWGDWSEADKQKWNAASQLGDLGRQQIKGHDLDYYLNNLKEVREHTLAAFKERDDNWLMKVDNNWPWGPTNNYCKWFHVCEHESNHNGQIKWIKSRLPGIKSSGE